MTIDPIPLPATVAVPVAALVSALTITTADITAMMVAITALVTAAGIAVVNIMAARAQAKKLDEVAAKAEAIAMTVAKVDGHVNSEKTAAEGRETTLKRENELLREMLARGNTAAALLAQAAATATQAGTAPTAAGLLPAIEQNTKETADNTARTDAKVDALKPDP